MKSFLCILHGGIPGYKHCWVLHPLILELYTTYCHTVGQKGAVILPPVRYSRRHRFNFSAKTTSGRSRSENKQPTHRANKWYITNIPAVIIFARLTTILSVRPLARSLPLESHNVDHADLLGSDLILKKFQMCMCFSLISRVASKRLRDKGRKGERRLLLLAVLGYCWCLICSL